MTAPKAFEIHLSNFDWSLRSLTALDPYGSELIEDDVSLAGTFIMPLSSGRTKGLAVKGGRVNASSTAETTASYTASRFILAVLLESDHLPFRRRLVSLQQASNSTKGQRGSVLSIQINAIAVSASHRHLTEFASRNSAITKHHVCSLYDRFIPSQVCG